MGSIPSKTKSGDQIWKDGRPFTSVKRVKRACIPVKVNKWHMNSIKVGFLRQATAQVGGIQEMCKRTFQMCDLSAQRRL